MTEQERTAFEKWQAEQAKVSEDVAEFQIKVPDENDAGFMGFMLDLETIQETERLTDMKQFIEGLMITDKDPNEIFRQWTLQQFKDVMAQVGEAVAPKKTDD